MKEVICSLLGHKCDTHLDYIYGTLPREHTVCLRCERTVHFEKPTYEREIELRDGWIGDGAVPKCKAL